MTIPTSYVPASWRTTTPFDAGHRCIGIGFDLADGSVLRMRLDHVSAAQLCETLRESLLVGVGKEQAVVPAIVERRAYIEGLQAFHERWGIHSPSSSGSRAADVSPQDAEQVCPPTKSSRAGWIDPQKEAEAARQRIAYGLTPVPAGKRERHRWLRFFARKRWSSA